MLLISYNASSSTKHKFVSFVLLGVLALATAGCSLFGDSVSGDSQSGGTSLGEQIRNLVGTYDVTYDLDEDQSTCKEVIPTYTVQAVATAEEQNERILLHYRFADAPVSISGFYDHQSDDYEAETPPVLIQGTQYAQEMWSVGFQKQTDEISFFGRSVVDFGERSNDGSDVDPDCSRVFDVSGIRLSF